MVKILGSTKFQKWSSSNLAGNIEMVKILGSTKFHQNIPNLNKDMVKTCWYKGLGTDWKDKKSLEVSQPCKRWTVVFIEE